MWQAIACLICTAVLWAQLDFSGASEFSGGRVTGPVFSMANLGGSFFLLAMLIAFVFRRTAATITLMAALLCLPFYLYILMPGPYRRIFKGEYSAPLQQHFQWDNWAVVGLLSLFVAVFLSLRNCSKVQLDS